MGEHYLLVQLADIGDLVLTTPAISALREARPDARIDLFVSAHAIPLLPEGLVNRTIPFKRNGQSASRAFFTWATMRQLVKLRRSKYDAVVFFHHFSLRAGVLKFWLIAKASGARRIIGLKNQNIGFLTDFVQDDGFGARHQAQYWLDLVALLGACDARRPASVRREAYALASLAASAENPRTRVVLHTGSGGYSHARRWLPEGFAAVARELKAQHGAEIILVGREEDDTETVKRLLDFETLDVTGQTTLPQLADIIARADLFIGADSGVMHIAAATGTPVISIFGPSNADAWQTVDDRWSRAGRAQRRRVQPLQLCRAGHWCPRRLCGAHLHEVGEPGSGLAGSRLRC